MIDDCSFVWGTGVGGERKKTKTISTRYEFMSEANKCVGSGSGTWKMNGKNFWKWHDPSPFHRRIERLIPLRCLRVTKFSVRHCHFLFPNFNRGSAPTCSWQKSLKILKNSPKSAFSINVQHVGKFLLVWVLRKFSLNRSWVYGTFYDIYCRNFYPDVPNK